MKWKSVDILLPSKGQYEALFQMTSQIKQAFDQLGLKATLIYPEEHFTKLLKNPSDFSFGINGAPTESKTQLLHCQITKKPHITLLVDPAYRFLSLMECEQMLIGCDDTFSCQLYRERGFEKCFFLPHATSSRYVLKKNVKRLYDAVFFGTCIPYQIRLKSWHERFPSWVAKCLEEAFYEAFSRPKEHFALILHDILSTRLNGDFSLLGTVNPTELLQDLEIAIKGYERVLLIKHIKCCQIDIFGASLDSNENWQSYFETDKHIKVHPEIPFNDALDIMSQSKIVLNTLLKNPNGAHERVFNAFAMEACPITNENVFLSQWYKHGENILFFTPDKIEHVDRDISNALQNDKWHDIACQGRAITMQEHTWNNRVNVMMEMLNLHFC